MLTKKDLANVLVGLSEDGFDKHLDKLTSFCYPDELLIVQRMSAILRELFDTFDFRKSPEFLCSILDKSPEYRAMKLRLFTSERRTEQFKRLGDALVSVRESDDVFDLLEEPRHKLILEYRNLFNQLSNADSPP